MSVSQYKVQAIADITGIKGIGGQVYNGIFGKLKQAGAESNSLFGKAMGGFKKTGGVLNSGLLKIGAVAGIGFSMARGAINAVTNSIGDVVKRSDTLAASTRNFQNMGFSADTVKKSMDALDKSITGLPTPMNEAVQGVQLIAASTNDLGKSTEIYSAMNNAILGFGGDAAMVNNAVLQLSQGFSDNKINAQTWNSMLNSQMGPALNAIAKKMGMTTGELKEGLSSGKVSVKEFQDQLISLNKDGGGGLASLQSIAKDATKGISTSLSNMRTAFVRAGANVVNDIGVDKITGIISSFTPLITQIGNGIGQVLAALPWDKWANGIQKYVESVTANLKNVNFSKVGADLAKVLDVIGQAAGALFGVAESLKPFAGIFIDIVSSLANAIIDNKAFINDAFKGIADVISGVFNTVSPILSGLLGAFKTTFGWLIDHKDVTVAAVLAIAAAFAGFKIAKGILSAVTGFQNLAKAAKESGGWIKAIGGIGSKATASIEGVAGSMGKGASKATSVSGKVVKAFGTAGKSIGTFLQNLSKGLGKTVETVVRTAVNSGKIAVNGIGQILNSAAKGITTALKTLLQGMGQAFVALGQAAANPMFWMGLLAVAGAAAAIAAAFFLLQPLLDWLIATAIPGLITGVGMLLNVLGTFVTTVLQAFYDMLANFIVAIAPSLIAIIQTIGVVLTPVLALIGQVAAILGTVLVAAFNAIVAVIQSLGSTIVGVLYGISSIIMSLGMSISMVIMSIGVSVSMILAQISVLVVSLGAAISNVIMSIGLSVQTILMGISTLIMSVGMSISTVITSIGTAINIVLQGISTVITSIGNAITGVINAIANGISGIINSVSGMFNAIGSNVGAIASKGAIAAASLVALSGAVMTVMGSVLAAQGQFNNLRGKLGDLSGAAPSAAAALASVGAAAIVLRSGLAASTAGIATALALVTSSSARMSSATKASFQGVSNAVGNAFRNVPQIVSSAMNSAVSSMNSAANSSHRIGLNFSQGFANGIISGIGSIRQAATQAANAARDQIKASLGIHSPSRVMRWYGDMTSLGFAKGMLDNETTVQRNARTLANAATFMGDFTHSVTGANPETNGLRGNGVTVVQKMNPPSSLMDVYRAAKNGVRATQ